jgi:membrane-bound serine protease (ClpP class)
MTAYFFPILLQVIGVLVVVAEVFIPSMGLLSVTAIGVISYSLYLVHTEISAQVFWIFLGGDLMILPLVMILSLKTLGRSPLALNTQLSSRQGVVSQSPDQAVYLDKTGKTITALRPSGVALIQGKRLDVVANGEYMDADTPIRVVRVSGNQIVVNRLDSGS